MYVFAINKKREDIWWHTLRSSILQLTVAMSHLSILRYNLYAFQIIV